MYKIWKRPGVSNDRPLPVEVIHNASHQRFSNVDGIPVGSVQRSLAVSFNIPDDACAVVDGIRVDWSYRLRHGDVLEFVRERGRKGVLEPDELARLERIEKLIQKVESWMEVIANQRVIKDWYTTKEVAELLGKKEYTVREWCRLRRVNGEKVAGGRGNEGEWRIRHEELMRIQNHGLLPMPTRY